MAFPPKPPPFTADPDGKPGIPDHLVENARRAIELARSEAELNMRVQRVAHRMRVNALPSALPPCDIRSRRGAEGAREWYGHYRPCSAADGADSAGARGSGARPRA